LDAEAPPVPLPGQRLRRAQHDPVGPAGGAGGAHVRVIEGDLPKAGHGEAVPRRVVPEHPAEVDQGHPHAHVGGQHGDGTACG
jgi:hypothetical protein